MVTVLLFDDVPIVSAGRRSGQNCDGAFEAKAPIATRSAGQCRYVSLRPD